MTYLNATHQRDGTHLLKSNNNGVLDIVFRTEDTAEHEIFWVPEKVESEEMSLADNSFKGATSDGVFWLVVKS